MKILQMPALAMLLGSIPFGYIAVYIRDKQIADESSRAIGSIRDAVGVPALVVMVILNVAKGFVPVYLTMTVFASVPFALLVGAIAVASHCFPYWFMFKPMGKGGSVAIGAIVAIIVSLIR